MRAAINVMDPDTQLPPSDYSLDACSLPVCGVNQGR
jgi:hypothetical protein